MIYDLSQYQNKYQEMMALETSIRILEAKNPKLTTSSKIDELKNKLSELQTELSEYKEANS